MTASRPATLDAIVIGSGPTGLAAAVALARAGRSVRVYEAQATVGGATRSLPLTEPGFVHDVCATVHALVAASPFLSSLPLVDFGYEFLHAPAPFAHPLDDGTAVVGHRSVDATAEALRRAFGRLDGRAARSDPGSASFPDGAIRTARNSIRGRPGARAVQGRKD